MRRGDLDYFADMGRRRVPDPQLGISVTPTHEPLTVRAVGKTPHDPRLMQSHVQPTSRGIPGARVLSPPADAI